MFSVLPQVGGEPIYSSDGEPYLRVPRSLAAKLGDAAVVVLNYLDTIMGNNTEVAYLTDRMIHDATGLSLRTVQRALHKLQWALGQINRVRRNGYRIILRVGLILDRKPQPEKEAPKKKTEAKPAPEQPAPAVDLEVGRWAVEFCEGRGWRIALRDGKITKEPIEGREQQEIPSNFAGAFPKYVPSIRAFLAGTHQRE